MIQVRCGSQIRADQGLGVRRGQGVGRGQHGVDEYAAEAGAQHDVVAAGVRFERFDPILGRGVPALGSLSWGVGDLPQGFERPLMGHRRLHGIGCIREV